MLASYAYFFFFMKKKGKVYIYVSKYEKGGETYGGAHRSKRTSFLAEYFIHMNEILCIIITAEEV